MNEARIKITHPKLGTFTSVVLNAKEDKDFLEKVEDGFKKGVLEYLSFNQDTSEQVFAEESRIVLSEKILNESVLVINFY